MGRRRSPLSWHEGLTGRGALGWAVNVVHYAQRGWNIILAFCVGVGMCAAVCPRGVLSLENGPQPGHSNNEYGLSMLGEYNST